VRDNAILPPTVSGDGAGARFVCTDCVTSPTMALVHASVRHCRLRLAFPRHVLKRLDEFLNTFFYPFRGTSVKALGSDGGVGWELRRVGTSTGGNFEDYIRFVSCHLFGPVNHGQNWKGWERSGENLDYP